MEFEVYCDEARQDLFTSKKPAVRYLMIGSLWLPASLRNGAKAKIREGSSRAPGQGRERSPGKGSAKTAQGHQPHPAQGTGVPLQ